MYDHYQQRPNPNQQKPNPYQQKPNPSYTINDLLKGKDLEIVAASLLLLGKLRVDSVELFRDEPSVVVSLVGKFNKAKNGKSNQMADFLKENGDMTLDDLFEGIKKRMNIQ